MLSDLNRVEEDVLHSVHLPSLIKHKEKSDMFLMCCVGSMYYNIENRWFVQLLKITNIFDIDTSGDISFSE